MSDLARYERILGPLMVGLRRDLEVTRQQSRGGPRYVFYDPVSFQNHAFSRQDYRVLMAMNPERTLAESFEALVEEGVLGEEDKQGYYEFILWLHDVGVMQLPVGQSDVTFQRYERKEASKRAAIWRAFLSYKIPLFNPDRFLQRTLKYFGWVFGRVGLTLWIGLMALVLWKCTGRFGEMFGQSAQLLSLGNLPILWLAMVILKALHEFGHAYACRRFGGVVPEMGIVFIILTPCAYVDATSSWKFGRRSRVAVAMAGMYVESIVAGIFALVWAGTQPGLLHDVALNVVILASITTVFLNINPLMKFDGYYVMSDLLGVFNLQERATRYLKNWSGYFALGLPRPTDDYSKGERWLYAMFGPATFVYRVILAFTITVLVMQQWPGAGVFLAVAFVWALMIQPVLRLFQYLWTSTETEGVRTRARLVAASAVAAMPLLLGLLPVSQSVIAPGVLVPKDRDSVRAPASGFVMELPVDSGSVIEPGGVVCVLRDPELEANRMRLMGELEAAKVSLDAVELEDSTLASIHRSRITALRTRVRELDDRLQSMSIAAVTGGTVVRDLDDDVGRFVRRGEELMQVHSGHRFVRFVLTDYEVSRARLEIGSVAEVRWTCRPDRPSRGVVRELRRSASRRDVPMELTMLAGGEVYARPTGDSTAEARQPYLHVFLEVEDPPLSNRGTGLTARVRLVGRIEVLGSWIKHSVLSFLDAWRMS